VQFKNFLLEMLPIKVCVTQLIQKYIEAQAESEQKLKGLRYIKSGLILDLKDD
jgi:hypothetical protein